MFAKLQRLADRVGTWTTLFAFLGGGGAVAVVAGWISSYSAWVSSFGAIGWVIAGLVCGVLFVSLCLLAAWIRLTWIKGDAINKWKLQVDRINPLDSVITHQRIDFAHIIDPIGNKVIGKTFTSCDLIGPSVVMLNTDVNLLNDRFFDCDFIVLGENDMVCNATMLADCTFNKCRFFRMTFYVHPAIVPEIAKMGAKLIGSVPMFTKP